MSKKAQHLSSCQHFNDGVKLWAISNHPHELPPFPLKGNSIQRDLPGRHIFIPGQHAETSCFSSSIDTQKPKAFPYSLDCKVQFMSCVLYTLGKTVYIYITCLVWQWSWVPSLPEISFQTAWSCFWQPSQSHRRNCFVHIGLLLPPALSKHRRPFPLWKKHHFLRWTIYPALLEMLGCLHIFHNTPCFHDTIASLNIFCPVLLNETWLESNKEQEHQNKVHCQENQV